MSDDDRDEPDREHDDEPEADAVPDGPRGGLSFFAGFALGTLLGVGAALLFAPARGEVTRKRLRRRLRSLRADAAERLGDARDTAEREFRRQRRRLRRHLPQR
jgi:uncharacterized membrane protein YccC